MFPLFGYSASLQIEWRRPKESLCGRNTILGSSDKIKATKLARKTNRQAIYFVGRFISSRAHRNVLYILNAKRAVRADKVLASSRSSQTQNAAMTHSGEYISVYSNPNAAATQETQAGNPTGKAVCIPSKWRI